MFSRILLTFLIIIGLLFSLLACGRGSDVNTPAPITDSKLTASSINERMLWGIWDITIDGITGDVDIVQSRTATFTANITRLIQPPAYPMSLLQVIMNIPESDIHAGKLVFDLGLSHPLLNDLRFRAFDCRGIIMAMGGNVGIYDPSVFYPTSSQTHMINPDGHSRWWNQIEFTTYETIFGYTEGVLAHKNFTSTSTLNPYKLHTPSLEPAQPVYQMNLDDRATFPVSTLPLFRTYKMQFDISSFPVFGFKYCFDVSWALPDESYYPIFPVEAYPPEANCQEAYYLRIEEFEEIPYYVDEWVGGGDLQFLLTIGDWQAMGGNVLNEISHVWIESPTLFGIPIDVRDTMEFVESTHDTMATYRIYIEDMLPSALEGQQILITVESADPDTYAPQIGGPGPWIYPDSPLAAYYFADVPVTNLTPDGDYAYVYFVPDWCATMRTQCTENQQGDPNTSGNQPLIANMMKQNIDGYYNDYTHVQVWEGKFGGTAGQSSAALQHTCTSLGYSFARTYNPYFDPANSRVVLVIGLSIPLGPPDPPFTNEEAIDMKEFIENGGILIFMCEASTYFWVQGFDELFDWLGMLMQYGGGATPEFGNGFTENITWHWMTDGIELYHYYSVGQWLTEDPHVLTLVETEFDEKLILIYPLPLE
ncbi:hypothetical protein KAU08_02235 [bacterium]|nr:hypothetical protein [bacterium]